MKEFLGCDHLNTSHPSSLVVLLLGIRFPTISYNVQFEKLFMTILLKTHS